MIKNTKSCDIINTSSSQRSNASNSVENYKKKNSLKVTSIKHIKEGKSKRGDIIIELKWK